ncbi:hypothetical protein [Streptomyces alkaliphilus]|uniref:hypothetical protein n=1 Tax=Streptomyces alkaliphilus TaxID=1472722 RepID=UPI00117DA910|nr:hypothetical protein [Streptomyces alkaliphilus]MQS08629.1 hypothetical protein [Streptomyces alkaliphilus]
MGSLRTPVGPLPSSIYWRRRGVALLLLASLGLLVWWAMNIGGTGSTGSGDDGAGGPATSISPEPDEDEDGDEDLVEDRPGGRDPGDEDDDDADDDAGEDTGDAEGTGDGTGDGADGDGDPAGPGAGDVEGIAIDDPAAPAGSGGAGGSDGGSSGGSTGSGGAVAASLPRCPGGALELSLSPVSNSYPPGELPRLRLTLTNTSSADCRADLGHRSFTLTMTRTDDGNRTIWDSTTCPTGSASAPVAVPADDGTERIITWDRRRSVEDCDTRGPEAPYGTYLAEAEIDGFPVARTTFRLEED